MAELKILESVNLAYLQTLEHILTEMESQGVPDLPSARFWVTKSREKMVQNRRMYRHPKMKLEMILCPECNDPKNMETVMVKASTTVFDDDTEDYYKDNLACEVYVCKKCGYSFIKSQQE